MDRALLADFLRARREALQPEEVGLPLLQTRPAVALFGDYTRFTGMSRYLVYRWFTDPAQRALYPAEDHAVRGRVFTVDIRAAYTADPTGTAGEIVEALLAVSPKFAEVWRLHEVDVTHHLDLKRYRHPQLGELELHSRRLMDPDEGQDLLVFLAEPGSPSDEKLQRLSAFPPSLSADQLSVDNGDIHPVPGSRHA